jgi:hypothetical protein
LTTVARKDQRNHASFLTSGASKRADPHAENTDSPGIAVRLGAPHRRSTAIPLGSVANMTSKARRLGRERRTVERMIALYCRDHHAPTGGLCAECSELAQYAAQRIVHCPFDEDKPTCANCLVHCYKPKARERIREVMRYSGPRMLLRHPILALAHMIEGRREAPELPQRRGQAPSKRTAAARR